MKDKKNELMSISKIIQKINPQNALFSQLNDLQKLKSSWHVVVGAHYKDFSRPVGIKKKALVIECDHSSVNHDLNFQAENIKKRISYLLKKDHIKHIYFVVK